MKKLIDLFATPEGRKQHDDMIKKQLPIVLEHQRKYGFYSLDYSEELEREVREFMEEELKREAEWDRITKERKKDV